jgi:hypothetical protein
VYVQFIVVLNLLNPKTINHEFMTGDVVVGIADRIYYSLYIMTISAADHSHI